MAVCSMMKRPRGDLSISLITAGIRMTAFLGLFYTEKTASLSTISIFTFVACYRKIAALPRFWVGLSEGEGIPGTDDRFEFDAEDSSIIKGKWVFNSSIEPLCSDKSCPYSEKQITCARNGKW